MSLSVFKKPLQAIGKYDILHKIAEGGMGTVYKARIRTTGELVAIKILPPDLASDLTRLKRFEQEFWAALHLDHPNLVRALDYGKQDAMAYLVLEFVDGPSLGTRIDREGQLPEGEAVRIISQVAQALQYAHGCGVIHRDVKPDNILLRADGQAKLTDLGLIKDMAEDHNLTRPSSGLGTPHFMAPEQYTDAKHVDFRSDIYALGATLYMAVTGILPFHNCGSLTALKKKVNGEITPPRQLVPTLSEAVDRLIRRSMDPDPAKRPASCLQFVKELASRSGPAAPLAGSAELQPPAAQPDSASPAGKDRRASVRYRCTQGTSCTLETSFHRGATAPEDSWPATVQDVSTGGIGLLLARRFEPGTVLTVDMQGTDPSVTRELSARVNHVKPEGLGHWLHGCSFPEPLSQEELQQLV